jgi:hypothetical protein
VLQISGAGGQSNFRGLETKRRADGKVMQMILKNEQSDQDQTDSRMSIGR